MGRKKRCSRCGAEVTYIKGSDGKNIMVNAEMLWVKTVPGGRIDVYGTSGVRRQVRFADKTEVGAWLAYRPHIKTCKNPLTIREIRDKEAKRPIKRAPAAKIEQTRRMAERPQEEAIRLF